MMGRSLRSPAAIMASSPDMPPAVLFVGIDQTIALLATLPITMIRPMKEGKGLCGAFAFPAQIKFHRNCPLRSKKYLQFLPVLFCYNATSLHT